MPFSTISACFEKKLILSCITGLSTSFSIKNDFLLTIPFSIIAEIYLLLFNPFINVKLKRIFPEIFLNPLTDLPHTVHSLWSDSMVHQWQIQVPGKNLPGYGR